MNQDNLNSIGLGIKARDENALAELMLLKGKFINSIAFKMLHDWQDAEEATNSVFAHIWEKTHLWKCERGPYGGWFFTVSLNYLIMVLNKKRRDAKKHPALLHENALHLIETRCKTPSPEEKIKSEEIMLKIEDALEQIKNRKQRICWILKRIEGYKTREISEILGMNIGSVGNAYRQCERHLKKILSEETEEIRE